MTKKNKSPSKTAPAKAAVAKPKSSKVVAKTIKSAPVAKTKTKSKIKAKPAAPAAVKTVKRAAEPKAAVKPATPPPARPAAPSKAIEVGKLTPKAAPGQVAPRAPLPQTQRAMPASGKAGGARLTSPVAPGAPKPAATKSPQPVAAGAPPRVNGTANDPGTPRKPVTARHGFKTSELIVYPAHGVGRIVGIEEQEIAGISLELFVIEFEKDKMTLRVPTSKLASVGMRKLAEDDVVKKALETLKGRARIKRTMWSRRAQEYEAKINSGDLVSIAEVVRDLYRSEAQPEQSYSERQLYEAALDRMARELAAVDKIDERGAMQRITEILARSARGRRAAEEAQAAEAAGENEVKAA
jgi:CarD family transcriptional regulator